MFRVATDIGGTFTDLVLSDRAGIVGSTKVLSTPGDYSLGILNGITRLEEMYADRGFSIDKIVEVTHGTTVATNAILENKGAKTALITTKGFRDVLELRRLRIPYLYNLEYVPPAPMVPRSLRFEVLERMDSKGQVLIPLDVAGVEAVATELEQNQVEALAICLLHSYRNPAHEIQLLEILRARLPNVYISASAEVLPEIREYERTSTTVVNSYVGPVVKRYLDSLRKGLAERGTEAPLLIMESNGGVMSAELASEKPAQMVESGPAAGVIGALIVGQRSGYPNVIAFDMGGTTAKASLIEDGMVSRTTDYEVGANMNHSTPFVTGSGYALKLPMIDIAEVGNGGGSIASVSRTRTIKVGPESAGSTPGPVCYDAGGEQPTVTDASAVLGFLNPVAIAAGTLPINVDKAAAAIKRDIADPLMLSTFDAAYGIHAVANANMIAAIKSVSTNRGRDPRDFDLVAFGGNGALHAPTIARQLGIRRVIVPFGTGVLSAIGLLEADIEHHFVRTFVHPIEGVPLDELVTVATTLHRRAEAAVDRELGQHAGVAEVKYQYLADIRYIGQAHELTVPFTGFPDSKGTIAEITELFAREHERSYGYRSDDMPAEFFNVRVIARVLVDKAPVIGSQVSDPPGEATSRRVYFGPETGHVELPVLTRGHLGRSPMNGPLIVEDPDATIVAPPGTSVFLDDVGNIVVDLEPETTTQA